MTELVVFDLDGTLIHGDSAQLWLEFLVKQSWPGATKALKHCSHIMEDYDQGTMDMNAYMDAWLLPLIDTQAAQLTALASQFAEDIIRPQIYPDMLQTIEQHRNNNDELMIISASPKFVVEAIARLFHIENIIGIDIAFHNDKVTGNSLPPFSFGQGKVTQLRSWLTNQGRDQNTQVDHFYSDSKNDLPLFEQAKRCITINPNRELVSLALSRGWQIRELETKERSSA